MKKPGFLWSLAIGCGGLMFFLVIIGVIGAVIRESNKPPAPPPAPPRPGEYNVAGVVSFMPPQGWVVKPGGAGSELVVISAPDGSCTMRVQATTETGLHEALQNTSAVLQAQMTVAKTDQDEDSQFGGMKASSMSGFGLAMGSLAPLYFLIYTIHAGRPVVILTTWNTAAEGVRLRESKGMLDSMRPLH